MAELETALKLQNTEIKALSAQLSEKSQQVAGLMAAMELHAKEDHKDPELLVRHAKHIEKAKTEARAAHKKHQEEARVGMWEGGFLRVYP